VRNLADLPERPGELRKMDEDKLLNPPKPPVAPQKNDTGESVDTDEPSEDEAQDAEDMAEELHMAGKHDQRSHGRKGGRAGSKGESAENGLSGGGGGEPARDFGDDMKAADNWALAQSEGAFGSMPGDEQDALFDYQGSGYYYINRGLRGNNLDAEDAAKVKLIDSAMSRASISESVVVHRGMTGAAFGSGNATGKTITDSGYVSTSLNRKVAYGYSSDRGDVQVQIRLPKGSKALYIDTMSENVTEYEMLLPRGSRFRVISDTGRGGNRKIEMELVP
jgi:hypothetical protein